MRISQRGPRGCVGMNPYSRFADWIVEKITIPNPEYHVSCHNEVMIAKAIMEFYE